MLGRVTLVFQRVGFPATRYSFPSDLQVDERLLAWDSDVSRTFPGQSSITCGSRRGDRAGVGSANPKRVKVMRAMIFMPT
jgi:hypothetical protein